MLEWVATPFSGGSSRLGTEPVSLTSPALADGFFTTEPPGNPTPAHFKEAKGTTEDEMAGWHH